MDARKHGRNGEQRPAMPLYVTDWLTSRRVRLMTNAERGVFIEALCHSWREGSMPASLESWARLIPDATDSELRTVMEAFPLDPDGERRNPREERERTILEDFRNVKAEAGRRSGEARREQAASKRRTDGEQTSEQTTNKSEPPSPSSSPSPSEEKKSAPRTAAAPLGLAELVTGTVLDTPACREALDSWLAYKRQRGQGYKPLGLRALVKDALAIGPVGLAAAVQHSMACNYAGLFAAKSGAQQEQPKATGASGSRKEWKPDNEPRIPPPPNMTDLMREETRKARERAAGAA